MTHDCDPALLYEKMDEDERGYLVDVMSTTAGRAVLWAIIRACGTREPSYDPTSPTSTEFNEGMGLVGLSIEHAIRASNIALYRTMEDEADERDRTARSLLALRAQSGLDDGGGEPWDPDDDASGPGDGLF